MEMQKVRRTVIAVASWLSVIVVGTAQATPIVFSAAGPNGASIQATVDSFRASLGGLNPNVAGSFGSGRREINWDGVPDALSAPNNLPANFFNSNSPRGVVFSTPGTGFQVSANASVAPTEFDNLNPLYSGLFATFSPQRLFTALGSNIVDVNFFIPGQAQSALTNGFGAVFTDVDFANTTSLSFFDANNVSLGTFVAPNFAGNETLSFLGVMFNEGAVVSRVRITNGNAALGGAESLGVDLVVMDDFIYGEPRRVSEPEPVALFALAALLALIQSKRRRD